MRIDANTAGEVLRFLWADENDPRYSESPPEGTTETLDFDGESNPQIVRALRGELASVLAQNVRLSGGVLMFNGQPVPINPPSTAYSERRAGLELARGLKAYNGLGSPTNAQSVGAIKANNRLTLILARALLREVAGE